MRNQITDERKAELEKAFDDVRSRVNWKRPINKLIYASRKQQMVIAEAVMFFTGSNTTFEPAAYGKVRIRAAGYYASEVQ
jgi:hypothetical protein